jgi:NarL family two-component system response regulator LiaR
MSTNKQSPVAVVVARHPLAAGYLTNVLRHERSIQVRQAGDPSATRDRDGCDPVYLIDRGGIECTPQEYLREVTSRRDSLRFIVIDHHFEFYQVCRLLGGGAQGVLTYDQVHTSLATAIHTVFKGGMWVEPEVLQRYLRLRRWERNPPQSRNELTMREQEILHMTRQRFSNKEIACKLDITVSTVKYHLSNIYSKMEVASRSDLWRDAGGQIISVHDAGNSLQEHRIGVQKTETRSAAALHRQSNDLALQGAHLRVG